MKEIEIASSAKQPGWLALGGVQCVSDQTDRDLYWSNYFDDERPFSEIVRAGIYFHDRVAWVFGMGLKPNYGPISQGKAGRLFREWQADPERFEAERPRVIADAVLEWGRDAEADQRRAEVAWEELERRLPIPPDGYYWYRTFGCIIWDVCDCTFRLWSSELGYPPHEGG